MKMPQKSDITGIDLANYRETEIRQTQRSVTEYVEDAWSAISRMRNQFQETEDVMGQVLPRQPMTGM